MKDKAEIQEDIGDWLAAGHDDGAIIGELMAIYELSEDEAASELREVYNSWQNTVELLDLSEPDLLGWHIFLRKRLLQKALEDPTIPSLKLALGILDSLATIQNIGGEVIDTTPVTVVFEAEEKKEKGVSDE